jgi:Uma2 family endonuclease
MTLAEYQTTPKTVLPQELIRRVMRVADAPSVNHQRVVFRIARALQDHADANTAGEVLIAPVDVVLDADLVVQPDLAFVTRERAGIVEERIYGPPDLVLEVLSPDARIGSLEERLEWFVDYGVREIWLYHQPRRRLQILACERRTIVERTTFDPAAPVRSGVLPFFTPRLDAITGW